VRKVAHTRNKVLASWATISTHGRNVSGVPGSCVIDKIDADTRNGVLASWAVGSIHGRNDSGKHISCGSGMIDAGTMMEVHGSWAVGSDSQIASDEALSGGLFELCLGDVKGLTEMFDEIVAFSLRDSKSLSSILEHLIGFIFGDLELLAHFKDPVLDVVLIKGTGSLGTLQEACGILKRESLVGSPFDGLLDVISGDTSIGRLDDGSYDGVLLGAIPDSPGYDCLESSERGGHDGDSFT